MPKREVLDDEGKLIDPAKNLGAFLQKIDATPAPADETPAPPSWKTIKFDDVEDPDLKGKTGEDAVAAIAARRKEAETATQRAAELERELEQERRNRQIEDTTRRVLAEQQAQTAKPEGPKVDPREAQIDELWFTDPPAARALLRQLNDERIEERISAATSKTEQDVMTKTQQADLVRQARTATEQATAKLLELGVSRDVLSRRAHLVMSDLANPVLSGQPNKWFYAGGPTKVDNILGLWEELFGLPKKAETPAPTATPVPAITAPPGSAKPAAAAAPAKAKEVHIDASTKRDYERMAKASGLNPEKLIERRRKRLEGDAHA